MGDHLQSDTPVLLRRQEPSAVNLGACSPRLLPSQEHGSSQEHKYFIESASRLSGLMGVLFHWTPAQFWAATPQEVAVLFEALADVQGGRAEGVVVPPDAEAMARLRQAFPD